jgi:glycosyltransferase involved in cell wall biosynthesis
VSAAPRGPRLRVLHVVRNLHDGGLERAVADLARFTDPSRCEVHVMPLEYAGRFATQLGPGTRLHPVPRMTKLSLLHPAALAAAIRAIAPDVVHTHSGTWYKTARATAHLGLPLVYTDHGRPHPDQLRARLLDAAGARRTQRVVAVSAPLASQLARAVRIPHERIEVVLNGIDVAAVRSAAPLDGGREALGISPGQFVVGTVGRLEPVKGYDVLLHALARWPAGAPPVVAVIAGDGSRREELEALARSLGIADRVRFPGWIERPEGLYPLLDAFVLSSHSEGTSLSLLEAMAVGCAPVVTAVGGNADVAGPALAEWVVPPARPDAIAERLVELARSPARREAASALARGRIEAGFGLERTAERYLEIYHELARRPPGRLVVEVAPLDPALAGAVRRRG